MVNKRVSRGLATPLSQWEWDPSVPKIIWDSIYLDQTVYYYLFIIESYRKYTHTKKEEKKRRKKERKNH